MIGLTFDGNLLTAATLTDGGEIFAQAEQPAPGNDYREWLLSVSALIDSLRDYLSNTDRLGCATATLISLIDPDVIVLGGAGLQLDRLQERIPRKWPGYVQIDRSATRLATAKGGVTPAIRGAAFLAAEDTG